MATEKKVSAGRRSPRIEQLLAQRPSWVLRWGTLAIAVVFAAVGVGVWLAVF